VLVLSKSLSVDPSNVVVLFLLSFSVSFGQQSFIARLLVGRGILMAGCTNSLLLTLPEVVRFIFPADGVLWLMHMFLGRERLLGKQRLQRNHTTLPSSFWEPF